MSKIERWLICCYNVYMEFTFRLCNLRPKNHMKQISLKPLAVFVVLSNKRFPSRHLTSFKRCFNVDRTLKRYTMTLF